MATNPTRLQVQARDDLADMLNLLSRAARLDGNPKATPALLDELAVRLCAVSSAFGPDDIVARALERRALGLELSSGLAEMLTLLDTGITPLRMLWLDGEALGEQVRRIEEELGEV